MIRGGSGGVFLKSEFPRSGIVGNSSGIPRSKLALSRNSLGIPNTGGNWSLYRGDCSHRGVVVFTGGIPFIAQQSQLHHLRSQKFRGNGDNMGGMRLMHTTSMTMLTYIFLCLPKAAHVLFLVPL